jgi:CheY-like chemotaxis protein
MGLLQDYTVDRDKAELPLLPRTCWLGEGLRQQLRLHAGTRTMVLDDDTGFQGLLRCCGLSFTHYAGLAGLVEQLHGGRPDGGAPPWDLALVSLDLPGFAGLVAITQLRDRFPGLRICATIDAVDADLMDVALRAGANDYLVKRAAPPPTRGSY